VLRKEESYTPTSSLFVFMASYRVTFTLTFYLLFVIPGGDMQPELLEG
jgi:signal peptidase I